MLKITYNLRVNCILTKYIYLFIYTRGIWCSASGSFFKRKYDTAAPPTSSAVVSANAPKYRHVNMAITINVHHKKSKVYREHVVFQT